MVSYIIFCSVLELRGFVVFESGFRNWRAGATMQPPPAFRAIPFETPGAAANPAREIVRRQET